MYLNTLIAYIDKGIPVIAWGHTLVGVFVGYEDYGKVLLYITGNSDKPERITLEKAVQGEPSDKHNVWEKYIGGWIFVGEKKQSRPLAEIYREAINAIPTRLNIKTKTHCFGPEAFRAWAKDIENGKFDGMKPEEFEAWPYYTNYVCVLATNGSCCHPFLKRAREMNPDMDFLEEVSELYKKTKSMWTELEKLGGGFNITLEALQDKERCGKIAEKIREFADVTEEILRVLNRGLN